MSPQISKKIKMLKFLLIFCLGLMGWVSSQSQFSDILRRLLDDQVAQATNPPINIEVFGEALCPDTTRLGILGRDLWKKI
ncbi:unnamed protein product [Caenorhabditis angaria]|uniref:Secreted protein n=1 Tax=Caenorhabditis angaria TaxID=860376 RepID=A0A9P1IDJ5_9PELO|nr:unnamed protein product [Caenorhabditis angaria]